MSSGGAVSCVVVPLYLSLRFVAVFRKATACHDNGVCIILIIGS